MSNFSRLMALAAHRGWMMTPVSGELLDRLLADVPKGRAVDLGCGGGVVARRLAASGLDVLAIDALPEVCTALLARGDSPSVKVHCGAIQTYTGPRDFDVVCCLGTEIHESSTQQAEALMTWVRPGGVVISGIWTPAQALPELRQAYTAAGLTAIHQYVVPISDWLSHEKSLADRVRTEAHQPDLADRLDAWLIDALPHWVSLQCFAVFRGLRHDN